VAIVEFELHCERPIVGGLRLGEPVLLLRDHAEPMQDAGTNACLHSWIEAIKAIEDIQRALIALSRTIQLMQLQLAARDIVNDADELDATLPAKRRGRQLFEPRLHQVTQFETATPSGNPQADRWY
jgi:hypothetical protein